LQNDKLTIYENTNEEYITFITPECKNAIQNYLDMRSRYGEKLTQESFLIREQFDVRDPPKKAKVVKAETLARKIYDLSIRAGIKDKHLPICHGFRKFFTTQCVNVKLNPEIREMLLGHKIGLTSLYYKPTEEEMLEEYRKAINNLTINEEFRLKKKIEVLEVQKSRFETIIKDVEQLKRKYNRLKA
jgi:integrase